MRAKGFGRCFAALLWLSCAFAACSSTPGSDDGGVPGVVVGSGGGIVRGDGLTLSVPEGALTESVEIRVSVSDIGAPDVAGRVRVSRVFLVAAEREVKFVLPATVTLTYLKERLPAGVPDDAVDARRTDYTRAQERLNAILVDEASATVSGETLSLGTFWATAPTGPVPAIITVTPEFQIVYQGATVGYSVEVRDQSNQLMPGHPVVWSTTIPGVATISEAGEATAVGPGTTFVVARAGSAQGRGELRVAGTQPYPRTFDWENPLPQGNAVWAIGGDDQVLAVGAGNGTLMLRDQTGWSRLASAPDSAVHGVAIAGGRIVGVGRKGQGGILVAGDGTAQVAVAVLDTQLRSVWTDGTRGMAVGEGPQILELDAGTWTPRPSPTSESLLAVDGSSGDVIVVGSRGSVYRRQGAAWVAMAFAPLPQLQTAAALRGVEAWAISDTTLRAFAAGDWTTVVLPASPRLTLTAVGVAPGLLLVAGVDGAGWAYVLLDSGAGFVSRRLGKEAIHALWGRSATEVYAGGDRGALYRWDGQAWTPLKDGLDYDVAGVAAFRGPSVFAAVNRCVDAACLSRRGMVLRRDASGRFLDSGGSFAGELAAVGGLAADDLWAVGPAGGAYHYNGTLWTTVQVLGGEDLHDVQVCGSVVWLAGTGRLFTAGNLAVTWAANVGSGAIHALSCFDGGLIAAGDGFIARVEGAKVTLLDTTADGIQQAVWRAVWSSPRGEALIAGDARYLLWWNGVKFEAVDQPGGVPVLSIRAMWGSGIGDVYAVGVQRGGTGFALHFNGAYWEPIDAGAEGALSAVDGFEAGQVWIGGEGGALLRGVGAE